MNSNRIFEVMIHFQEKWKINKKFRISIISIGIICIMGLFLIKKSISMTSIEKVIYNDMNYYFQYEIDSIPFSMGENAYLFKNKEKKDIYIVVNYSTLSKYGNIEDEYVFIKNGVIVDSTEVYYKTSLENSQDIVSIFGGEYDEMMEKWNAGKLSMKRVSKKLGLKIHVME